MKELLGIGRRTSTRSPACRAAYTGPPGRISLGLTPELQLEEWLGSRKYCPRCPLPSPVYFQA